MAERDYSDFDLAIEAVGERHYRARVLRSPSGQARVDFDLPFSDLELENFLLRIGRPRSGVRRLESPEAEAARSFGRKLFDAVFAGDVGLAWTRSVDAAEHDDKGVRLRLRLSDAPGLGDLPWEYLYVPSSDRHLVLSRWTPLVRYVDLPAPADPLTVQPPLRLLAMVSSPTDFPALDTEAEWSKLDESLQPLEDAALLEVTRLEHATLRDLQRALRRTDYHVFHYIGHGGFEEQSGDGVLMLENDEGRGRKVTGRELGTILHDARSIRLAVLNACEGARSSLHDPFAGTAQNLVAGGIPAVVAMQFEISDKAAIVFAHELYGAVADGYPVDAALAEARRAIFGSGNDVEWGTPVLYMRSDDGKLFDMIPPPAGGVVGTQPADVGSPVDVEEPELAGRSGELPPVPSDDTDASPREATEDVIGEMALPHPSGSVTEAGEPAGESGFEAPDAVLVGTGEALAEDAPEHEGTGDAASTGPHPDVEGEWPPLSAEAEDRRREALEATLARAAEAERQGDWLTAVRSYEAVLTAVPEREDVAAALDRVTGRMRAEELLAEAMDLQRQGRLNEAAERWDELARVAPDMVDTELRDEAMYAGLEEPATAVAPSPPTREPPAPETRPRRRSVPVLVAIGLAVLAAVLIFALRPDDDIGGTTLAPDDAEALAEGLRNGDGGDEEPAQAQPVDSPVVTAVRLPGPITIDGASDDWKGISEAYLLQHVIFEDQLAAGRPGDAQLVLAASADDSLLHAQASGGRLGVDSPGLLAVAYDDDFLYLFVIVEDDAYDQRNLGDQIWRGDALDVNLSAAPLDSVPPTPDGTEVQITMTPKDANGAPAFIHFVGVDGDDSGFVNVTPDPPPVELSGNIEGEAWALEAAIPWEALLLDGPPEEVRAIFAVFDNDGEDRARGGPAQTVILANTDAGFQEPLTWGTLLTDG